MKSADDLYLCGDRSYDHTYKYVNIRIYSDLCLTSDVSRAHWAQAHAQINDPCMGNVGQPLSEGLRGVVIRARSKISLSNCGRITAMSKPRSTAKGPGKKRTAESDAAEEKQCKSFKRDISAIES